MEVHLKIIYSYGGMFKKVQRPQVLDSLFKGCSQMMALLWWLVPLKAHILCWAMFVFLLCKFCERKNEYSGTWRVPHMWWEREREGGEVKRERGEETEKGGRKKEKGRERSKKQATCYPQCLLRAVEYTCVRFRVKALIWLQYVLSAWCDLKHFWNIWKAPAILKERKEKTKLQLLFLKTWNFPS